jgi:hypothetical protein
MNTTYTLSEVCAGAYVKGRDSFLVHAVDVNGNPACGKVKADNLAGYANPKHTEPTCKKCLERWRAG